MPRNIIAIDPGANGAIVWKDELSMGAVVMPSTPADILHYLERLNYDQDWVCYIEGQSVRPTDGKASLWKYATHIGHLEMALMACRIPTVKVGPSTWMKALGPLPKATKGATAREKGEAKRERKNKIKDLMQRRYPNLPVTLKTADALGILTWALEQQ